jgi:ribosomal protein S18 acetylase RimI-like enzyme
VAALEGHATQLGYATLTLRTNNILKPALSFYAKAGFELERIQRRRLLRGDLLFYRKPLHVLRKIVA